MANHHDRERAQAQAQAQLGWRAVLSILALHAAALAIATYPTALTLGSTLPAGGDAYQHLWVLRWYKTCVLEGRPPFVCRELQYPTGAPLGNFSALQLQAFLYIPLSLVIKNDVLCYNMVWSFGMLLAGLGTALLGWYVLRDRICAAFSGLLAMLSAPMLIHATGHLELIYVGTFPVFLVAWMRFVDEPSRPRLLAAVLGYIVVAASAAYYMVFAVFPAVLYVAWQAARAGRRGAWPWLRNRLGWFAGFAGTSVPCLLLLFSCQVWLVLRGDSLAWPREEFEHYGAPLWGYAIPAFWNRLGQLLPRNPSATIGDWWERYSYLGVVTLGLVAYAAIVRVRFARAGYLWSALLLCVVLSLGASWRIGNRELSLPSDWLYRLLPVYRATRVPARFNLFAGVLAGVVAAAGLRHLLARFPGPAWRTVVFALLTTGAVADLAMIPFPRATPRPLPAGYTFVKQRNPQATILEIPLDNCGGPNLDAVCTYWQAQHRLTTSAGYSGHVNFHQASSIGNNSPFLSSCLRRPDYLEASGKLNFCLNVHVDFKDYVWLYLTANRFDYVVLHRGPDAMPGQPGCLGRLDALLHEAKVYEDADTTIYDRSLLKLPAHPVHVNLGEWRTRDLWKGRWNSVIPRTARIALYNPDATQSLTLVMDMAALHKPRLVRIKAGSAVVAQWHIPLEDYQHAVSPPFRLPAGLHELMIESQVAGRHLRRRRESSEDSAFRLRVARVSLYTDPRTESIAIGDRDNDVAAPETKVR